MIGFLSGKIQENQDGRITVFVAMGDGGVGYSVTTPSHSRYSGAPDGSRIELFIHTHVREDALDLYGFASREEKEIFLTLLTVSGIGPKGAMGILSKVELATLVNAILNDDQDSLTEVPGIGKKTAERVVRELADPLRKKMESGLFSGEGLIPSAPGAVGVKKTAATLTSLAGASVVFKDAKDALLGLGYREQEIVAALKKVQDSVKEAPKKTEDVVRLALKSLL